MSLSTFLTKNKIDLEALSRARNRIMVVGRFNQQRKQGEPPAIYLFVKDPARVNEEYKKNFDRVDRLDYDGFVRSLRPSISEKVVRNRERFPAFVLEVPGNEKDLESAFVIDRFNYFFVRAAATSEQEHFRREGGSRASAVTAVLPEDETGAGQAILLGIQERLQTFCRFQPQMVEVLDAMSKLLDRCNNHDGMPVFAHGAPLPLGFPARLASFLFSDDSSAQFKDYMQGIGPGDSDGYWQELTEAGSSGEKAREQFCTVVGAFRDTLLGVEGNPGGAITFGRKTLRNHSRDVLSEDLRRGFAAAREAFNGLRQIIRSRVLLATVLQWVIDSYNQIPDMKKLPPDVTNHERNTSLVQAITDRAEENHLKPAVKRPTLDERAKFKDQLTGGFEAVLRAVLNPTDKDAQSALDGPLRELVAALTADPEMVQLLKTISGQDRGEETHRAFIDAVKMVMTDVMLPVLFKLPVMSAQDLLRELQAGLMSGYLAAIFLSPQNQEGVRKIAEGQYEILSKAIQNGRIDAQQSRQVQQKLLHGFFEMIADKRVKEELLDGLDTLKEMTIVFRQIRSGALKTTVGSIIALGGGRTVSGRERVPEAARPAKEDVKELVELVAIETLNNRTRLAGEAAAASAVSSSLSSPSVSGGISATATLEPPGSPLEEGGGVATATAVEEESEVSTRIDAEIRALIDRMPTELDGPAAPRQPEAKQAAKIEWIKGEIENTPEVSRAVSDLLEKFQGALSRIYETYKANPDKRDFGATVERFSLANMMLIFKEDLALGKVGSNLYRMLLDLVRTVNPEDMSLKEFMRRHSLTEYFDDRDLNVQGLTALKTQLSNQGEQSLRNIVRFVSELRGIDYLFEAVSGSGDVEIVLVNADADEFVEWVKTDNLEDEVAGGASRNRMVVNRLTPDLSKRLVLPGLIVMSDIAFDRTSPEAWLDKLTSLEMQRGNLAFVLPPIVISTSSAKEKYSPEVGARWAEIASRCKAAVVAVGPSPRINRRGDSFDTFVPAGYMVGAHFLTQPEQEIRPAIRKEKSQGRHRILEEGNAREVLTKLFMLTQEPRYSLGADYFLYIVLLMVSAAERRAAGGVVDGGELYRFLNGDPEAAAGFGNLKADAGSVQALQALLWGGHGARYALGQDLVSADQKTLKWVWAGDGEDLFSQARNTGRCARCNDVDWFNEVRQALELP